jgi:hypothetical protein
MSIGCTVFKTSSTPTPFTDVNVVDFVEIGIKLYKPAYIKPLDLSRYCNGLRAGRPGFAFWQGQDIFSPQCPDRF